MRIQVKSVTLNHESGQTYVGGIEAENGDSYDLTVTKEYDNIRIKAVPAQATMEKQFSQMIEEQLGDKVSSISLTKGADGSYSGLAKTDGSDVDLTTRWLGDQLILNAKQQEKKKKEDPPPE